MCVDLEFFDEVFFLCVEYVVVVVVVVVFVDDLGCDFGVVVE